MNDILLWLVEYRVGTALLGLASIVTIAMGLERWLTLGLRKSQLAPALLLREIDQVLRSRAANPARLLANCQSSPSCLSTVTQAALDRVSQPVVAIETAVDRTLELEWDRLSSVTRHIFLMGRLSPFLGLLGSVTSMIVVFMQANNSGAGQGKLAQGVSEALLTTAMGILVAMVAFIIAHIAECVQSARFDQMRSKLLALVPLLAAFKE